MSKTDPLREAKEILKSLEKEIKEKKFLWRPSRCWLHGATEVLECNQVEKRLHVPLSLSTNAKSMAFTHHQKWGDHLLEGGENGHEYLDFSQEDVPAPEKLENLYEHILHLSYQVQDKGWGSKKNKRALRSFLFFLRRTIPEPEIAFLEHIFPANMDLEHGYLIRLIKPQAYPLPEEVAAEIIQILVKGVLYERANAQLKKTEALAFCWICLGLSRLRLPTMLESLHAISADAITIKNKKATIRIPTIFGPQKLQISYRKAKYLKVIATIPSSSPRKSIFQSTLHDLRRVLKSAIKKADTPHEVGEITFLSFTNPPHHAGKNIRPGNQKRKLSPSMPE